MNLDPKPFVSLKSGARYEWGGLYFGDPRDLVFNPRDEYEQSREPYGWLERP